LTLLQTHAGAMAECMGAHADILEFGAGSLHKIRLLLKAMQQLWKVQADRLLIFR
jgi:uncharacterized SAM-dependent methyltransferase